MTHNHFNLNSPHIATSNHRPFRLRKNRQERTAEELEKERLDLGDLAKLAAYPDMMSRIIANPQQLAAGETWHDAFGGFAAASRACYNLFWDSAAQARLVEPPSSSPPNSCDGTDKLAITAHKAEPTAAQVDGLRLIQSSWMVEELASDTDTDCNRVKYTTATIQSIYLQKEISKCPKNILFLEPLPAGEIFRDNEFHRDGHSRHFPMALCYLHRLEDLYITKTDIESIPTAIVKMHSLKSLWLTHNKITVLPKELFEMPKLVTLVIEEKLLTQSSIVSPSQVNMSLRELVFDGCQFTEVPTWISLLQGLNSVSFPGNKISEFPDWLVKLPELESIFFIGNQLHDLPQNLSKFDQLRYLNLDDNKFSKIPAAVFSLISIKVLQLNRNQITHISAEIGNLKTLERLGLRGNLIKELPNTFGNLLELTELDLQNNCFNKKPIQLQQLTKLTTSKLDAFPADAVKKTIWTELRAFIMPKLEAVSEFFLGLLFITILTPIALLVRLWYTITDFFDR